MLQHDAGWIAVIDERAAFLGVLTPARLHEALRRSIDADAQDMPARGGRTGDGDEGLRAA